MCLVLLLDPLADVGHCMASVGQCTDLPPRKNVHASRPHGTDKVWSGEPHTAWGPNMPLPLQTNEADLSFTCLITPKYLTSYFVQPPAPRHNVENLAKGRPSRKHPKQKNGHHRVSKASPQHCSRGQGVASNMKIVMWGVEERG